MGQPTANPIAEINSTRILIIKWPDETCTFVNEFYSEGVLTIEYKFKNTNGRPLEPYENSYKLDSFDTEIGSVRKVEFQAASQSAIS